MRRIAELKMLEFVISLRTYASQRTMALTCAMLCNLVQCDDSRSKRKGSPTDFDIYFQNFFLYILRELEEVTNNVRVSEDQVLTVDITAAIEVAEEISYYFDATTRDSLLKKLNSMGATSQAQATKSSRNSSNTIDLDKLLYIFLDEYITAKRKLEVDIVEAFLAKASSDKGSPE